MDCASGVSSKMSSSGHTLGSPRSVSFFNSVWTEQTQGCHFIKPVTTLQPPFQSQSSEPPLPLSDCKSSQDQFWTLTSYCHQTSTPKFVRITPPRWRLPSTAWVTCNWRPPIPTCLWASVSSGTIWLWRAWATSSRGDPWEHKGTNHLLKMQYQCGGHDLF